MVIKKQKPTTHKSTHQKIYLLDTNVLVHDPKALYAFENARVAIPLTVLEEMDRFKHEGTDRGRNARKTIRLLDELRYKGSLKDGVELENNSVVQVLFPNNEHIDDFINQGFSSKEGDNAILSIALDLKESGEKVTFISKDLNARVKADCLGIVVEDYIKDVVSKDEFYRGWMTVQLPAGELRAENPPALKEFTQDLVVNQFVLAESKSNPHNNKVFRYLGGTKFVPVNAPRLQWPLAPRNPQQLMAMHLLADETIQFACLFGPAGTGKTFLALLAGLHQVLIGHTYEKLLISRPVVPLGRDIGYLPGTIEEKLYSWMLPIYDNIEFITHAAKVDEQIGNMMTHAEDEGKGRHDKKGVGKKHHRHHDAESLLSLQDLIKKKKIGLEAITYMRGRSIPFQFILIDEAQNLTPHEIKTLVTRVGEGSKIILAGDPYQIDSPYLDFASNGLVYASERFKGQSLFGSVYLEVSERSELSDLASDLL